MHDKIDPPYHLKEFWTKYPQGLTIYEALLNWVDQVNLLIDANNLLVDEVDVIRQNYESYVSGVNEVLTSKANISYVMDELLLKADQLTTYTKNEVNASLLLKADQLTTYTKLEVDQAISETVFPMNEGTFTPFVKGQSTAGVGTYTAQTGKYIRVGKLVFFTIDLSWTAHTGAGTMLIDGFPFNCKVGSSFNIPLLCDSLTFPGGELVGTMSGSTGKVMSLYGFSSGGAIQVFNIDTSASMYFSGFYMTDDA